MSIKNRLWNSWVIVQLKPSKHSSIKTGVRLKGDWNIALFEQGILFKMCPIQKGVRDLAIAASMVFCGDLQHVLEWARAASRSGSCGTSLIHQRELPVWTGELALRAGKLALINRETIIFLKNSLSFSFKSRETSLVQKQHYLLATRK